MASMKASTFYSAKSNKENAAAATVAATAAVTATATSAAASAAGPPKRYKSLLVTISGTYSKTFALELLVTKYVKYETAWGSRV